MDVTGSKRTGQQVGLRYQAWDPPQDGIAVAVLGAVPHPGVYEVPTGCTVEEAAILAGANPQADFESFAAVTIRRPNGWDEATPREVACWNDDNFCEGSWRQAPLKHDDAVILQYRESDLEKLEVVPTGVHVEEGFV